MPSPSPLASQLDNVLPGFATYITSDANPFSHDSAHGIFAAFSNYVREHPIPPAAWDRIATFVHATVGGADPNLDNAACTCFLENLARRDHPLDSRLQGEARKYWRHWR